MVINKILEAVAFINSVFYGEHWYIAWGAIVLMLSPFIVRELPKLIKSIKEAKKRGKK